MQLEQTCKGICFDFDGVIVDSMPYHLSAWDRAHRSVFGEKLTEELLHSLIGYSTGAIAQRLCNRVGKLAAKEKLIKAKMAELMVEPENLRPLEGFTELVTALKQAAIPWAIVSNSPRSFLVSIMAAHQIETQLILGIEDVKRPKPEPDPYLQALRQFGLTYSDHSQALVFEDSVHGIKAAVTAKATVIGITSSQPAVELLDAGASACFPGLLAFYQSDLCRNLGIPKVD